jgi:hypothetical protein
MAKNENEKIAKQQKQTFWLPTTRQEQEIKRTKPLGLEPDNETKMVKTAKMLNALQ